MKTKILLIQILILTVTLVKGQDNRLSSDHDKIFSFNFKLGVNQIKEMNLLPLVHKGRVLGISEWKWEAADYQALVVLWY